MKRNRNMDRGFVQIYTGNGKGKTTAALGLVLRAAGWGYRSYVGQFMKGQHYGELDGMKRLGDLVVIDLFGRKEFIHVGKEPAAEDVEMARRALESCRLAMNSGRFRIVVLDEVNVAVYFNLITEQDVLDLLNEKPGEVELVLTGRYAPDSFVERADLVTEMREVKHYYEKGVEARSGIEK
jgi:cob(I)alamin adenosyltransferase